MIDVDHQAGTVDSTFRPNQILAVGGLPYAVLDERLAAKVVDAVESRLWTPVGLRTLAPTTRATSPATRATFAPGTAAITRARYGPGFWGRSSRPGSGCQGNTPAARREARRRFFDPLLGHLAAGGAGSRFGDRRRRAAPHPAGMPVPGLVGRGGAPARPERSRRTTDRTSSVKGRGAHARSL